MRVDSEIDLHGYTSQEARSELNRIWGRRCWQGLRRVRVIHGNGAVLRSVVRNWCEDQGIPWATEPMNPGTTILHPVNRTKFPPAVTHRPLSRQLHGMKYAFDREQKSSVHASRPSTDMRKQPLPLNAKGPEKKRTPIELRESSDLMAQEFERLNKLDASSIRRSKYS
jgi:hypothetical protein